MHEKLGVDKSGSGVSTPLIPDDSAPSALRKKTISGDGKRKKKEIAATASCACIYFRSYSCTRAYRVPRYDWLSLATVDGKIERRVCRISQKKF